MLSLQELCKLDHISIRMELQDYTKDELEQIFLFSKEKKDELENLHKDFEDEWFVVMDIYVFAKELFENFEKYRQQKEDFDKLMGDVNEYNNNVEKYLNK